MSGYSDRELDDIRQRYKIRFPPDLVDIYRKRRSVIDGGFDWIKTPRAEIERMLAWPLEGILFDVEHGLWLREWGEKPRKKSAAEEVAQAAVAAAPRLIPVHGHRYIPEEPYARGNPIFSVWQMDIIVYGANLSDYILHETHKDRGVIPASRRIRFWSQFGDYPPPYDE